MYLPHIKMERGGHLLECGWAGAGGCVFKLLIGGLAYSHAGRHFGLTQPQILTPCPDKRHLYGAHDNGVGDCGGLRWKCSQVVAIRDDNGNRLPLMLNDMMVSRYVHCAF